MTERMRTLYRGVFCLILFLGFLTRNPYACAAENYINGINSSGGANENLAVKPAVSGEGYSAFLYNNTNGLPTSEANAIARTNEGFIWIGSYSGLIRYDGNTFVRLDSTKGVASVVCLFTDSKDRLWIGTNDSGVAMMERDSFRKWGEKAGMKSAYVYAIAEDNSGNIYVASSKGVTVIDSSLKMRPFGDPRIDEMNMRGMRMGNDGAILGYSIDGDIFSIKDGKLDVFLDHEDNPLQDVMCVMPDPENPDKIYIGAEGSHIFYGSLKDGLQNLTSYDIAPLDYVENLEKIENDIWICAGNGIGVLEGDIFRTLDNIPMNNSVGHMMTDYEGNLWFTSTRQGVMKITPNQFVNLYEKNHLPEEVANTTCLYNGMLFVGTDTGLTVLDENDLITHIPLTKAVTASGTDLSAADLIEFLNGCRIRSIIRDSRNRLWISTWRKHGLLRYSDGLLTAFTVEDGLFSDRVRTAFECKDGSILAVNTGGVSVIEGDRITKNYGEAEGIANPDSLTAVEGKDGDIILGTDGGGMYVIGENEIRHLGLEDGLTSEIVMRVKKDPSRDIYWIVTSNSIAYMNDDYEITTVQEFPYSNNFDLYENSVGDIWVFSSNGIYVTPAEEMLANGKIEPVFYGMANGLTCIPTANSYSELTPEGYLYISGSTGVAKVNVENAYGNIGDLKAAVPYIDADDVRVYPDDNGDFYISSGTTKMTIYPFVYNYSLVDPLIEFRLIGFDTRTTTVSRDDLVPIDFTNLRGGTYNFSMKMMDSMGRGNKTISVRIIKGKAYYEQFWFYLFMGFLGIFCLTACVRMYVHRRMLILEQEHLEKAEKERITTELKMASKIQESMLPSVFPAYPDRKEFDIYASMEPAKEVGGDFYDFYLIDDDHLGMVMADVSGKGVPASLFMMITKTFMQSYAMLGVSASRILTRTNESLCANNKMEMFVTAWVGILEISTGKITAANAGHEYPAVYQASDGSFSLLHDKHGFVMGGMEGMKYKEYELQLEPGDKLFIYTDGVPEATNSGDELFGSDRMIEALNKDPQSNPREILACVREAVNVFVGPAEQFDDLTMLCLEYRGSEKIGEE